MRGFPATASELAKGDTASSTIGAARSAAPPGGVVPHLRSLPGADDGARAVSGPAGAPIDGETAAKRPAPRFATSTPLRWEGRANANPEPQPAGSRSHERRWRDAPIFLVERRKGDLWKYSSIALCVALWIEVWLLFRA
jgi:hypothetical protein